MAPDIMADMVALLGNWQVDQFMCIIRTPILTEVIMLKFCVL